MMTEDDFKTLPTNGHRFETLVAALLEAEGFQIQSKPAVGADGGVDTVVDRHFADCMGRYIERVAVQCKHFAKSGTTVADRHIESWQNAMTRAGAKGYLLVTDSRVTENVKRTFERFTADSRHGWAQYWDVDKLIQLLDAHPEVRRSFFPARSLEIDPPPQAVNLLRHLTELAQASEQSFDRADWSEFSRSVASVRDTLSSVAERDGDHFELLFHVKRSKEYPRLKELLSNQQLAYERMDEERAVEQIIATSKPVGGFDAFASEMGELDPFRKKTFEITRAEAGWLREYAPNPRRMVMVGCGALPYTLLHACWEMPQTSCTGLDYDNGSLILAHKVRKRLKLGDRLHYVTQNGHAFDYRDHDLILIANIVGAKHRVLKRVAETARRDAIVVVRNPVTFGELLWEDAGYSHLESMELAGRYDAKPFAQCFETVVLRIRAH